MAMKGATLTLLYSFVKSPKKPDALISQPHEWICKICTKQVIFYDDPQFLFFSFP